MKSGSRAAKGFSRSPEKVRKLAKRADGDLPESEEDDDDHDDLDGPARRRPTVDAMKLAPKPMQLTPSVLSKKHERNAEKSTDIFKRFAAVRDESVASASSVKRKDGPTAGKDGRLGTSGAKRSKVSDSASPTIILSDSLPKSRRPEQDKEMDDFLKRFGNTTDADGNPAFTKVRSGTIVGLLSIGTHIGGRSDNRPGRTFHMPDSARSWAAAAESKAPRRSRPASRSR